MSISATAILVKIAKILANKAIKWAKQEMMEPATVRGDWVGEYKLVTHATPHAAEQAGYAWGKPCKLFVNDLDDNPRRWVHRSSKCEYAAETPIVSDGGSTPGFMRKPLKDYVDLAPFGKFIDDFILHDSAYANAGCWVRESPTSPWLWLELEKRQADALFRDTMRTNGRRGEIFAIWRAVYRFGGGAWNAHRRREQLGETAKRAGKSE